MKFKITFLCAVLFFGSICAMEENQPKYALFNSKGSGSTKDFDEKSTNEDVITVFKKLIGKNINAIKLAKPKNLLDGIVQLNKLFRNLEVNLNESSSSFLTNGLLVNGAEIPSHPLFTFWMQEAIKLVLENNEKANSLVEFVVEKLAKNVSEDNKTRCISLVERYLPKIASEHLKRQVALTYGWQNQEEVNQRIIKRPVDRLFPLDSCRAVFVTNDNIKIWNSKTGNFENNITNEKKVSGPFAYNNANILAFSQFGDHDHSIKIWNIKTGDCLHTLKDNTSRILTLMFIDETTLISLTEEGGPIIALNVTTGQYLQPGKNEIDALMNKKMKASGTIKGNLTVMKINTSQAIRSLTNLHRLGITSHLFPLKGNKAGYASDHSDWSGDTKGIITVCDLKGKDTNKIFKGHSAQISNVISLNKTTLASSSYDKTIKIWDLPSGRCKRTIRGHTKGIADCQALNNNIIISSSNDGDQTVKIWNAKTGECLQEFDVYIKYKNCGSFMITNNSLVTCNGNNVRIIDFPTFEQTINFLAKQNSKKLENPSCTIC